MKYKTTIEIVSEAEDKNDAIEIVGEYLSGNLVSGVEMRCVTRTHTYNKKIVSALAISVVILIAAFSSVQTKSTHSLIPTLAGTNALQPQLRTFDMAKHNDTIFKKAWQAKETQEALDFIKR